MQQTRCYLYKVQQQDRFLVNCFIEIDVEEQDQLFKTLKTLAHMTIYLLNKINNLKQQYYIYDLIPEKRCDQNFLVIIYNKKVSHLTQNSVHFQKFMNDV